MAAVAVILPASVLTAHLESCAAELAVALPSLPPEELERVLAQLVSGQRHLRGRVVGSGRRPDGSVGRGPGGRVERRRTRRGRPRRG
ncbi:hypothetical protein [Actinophytocola gossypii]|uniref:Uncharacterized protein n=1 Tax=Actinophytocola gossypii TaxID=2812003 RepID=A0ABT2JIW9_9PSEU|nr:hypothetical protein [Actinophytocola gossypii]MCT2587731.1 hypothetical protein [Actinophytocola gossypii]